MTTPELLDAVRRFMADNFPGRTPRRLHIYTVEDGAEPISLPVPFMPTASAPPVSPHTPPADR